MKRVLTLALALALPASLALAHGGAPAGSGSQPHVDPAAQEAAEARTAARKRAEADEKALKAATQRAADEKAMRGAASRVAEGDDGGNASLQDRIKAAADQAPKAAAPTGPAPSSDGLPAWAPASTPKDAETLGSIRPNWDEATGPAVSYPWIESHGYFRVRSDLFYNFDLDTFNGTTGSSPVRPPLTELPGQGSGHPEQPDHSYKRGANSLASTNMRLRYQPTIHVNENLRIRTTLDVLDNLVFGSTPDGGRQERFGQRPDVVYDTFSGGQRPPESGVNGYKDSVRVKHLWGEWKTPVGLLMFGRTMSHWGLGVLANNGNCLDCNFGDSVDRIMGITKLFNTYVALAWDFPSEGVTGFAGQNTRLNQPFGQEFDLDNRDDVNEWVIALFDRPMTLEEKERRARDLNEVRKPVWDWGVYNVVRNQAFTTIPNSTNFLPYETAGDEQLRDIKAFAFIPDLWLRWEYRPKSRHKYSLEFEAVGVFGVMEELPVRYTSPIKECTDKSVTNIEDCSASDTIEPRRREIQQFGYAFEFNAQQRKLKYGFHHGVASGDTSDGFGVLDKTPLDANAPNDKRITNFKFDRDYYIDLIMFRELIGTVTNAAYFKPYIAYDLIQRDKEAWGFKLAAVYGQALEKAATPGRSSALGLEFDLELYVVEQDVFKWSFAYGLLFPFGAFDQLNAEQTAVEASPGIAQTMQINLGMQF